MNKLQALHAFWSGFKLPAYDENTVPESAELPYITYEVATDDFGDAVALTASLWWRSNSWEDISLKEQEIADYIGRGGRMIAYEGGAMWIQKASPWSQRLSDESSDTIRRIILNISVEYMD